MDILNGLDIPTERGPRIASMLNGIAVAEATKAARMIETFILMTVLLFWSCVSLEFRKGLWSKIDVLCCSGRHTQR